MKKCTATILLLMLAAVSLVFAGDDVDTTIRLPSDGKGLAADEALTGAIEEEAGAEKKRPWDCCDRAVCTSTIVPFCVCFDEVERCADACKDCEQAESDPSLHFCRDMYIGDPGPRCTEDAAAGGN